MAWADRRAGVYDQIYFMRVDATGGVLQAATPITFASAYSQDPSMVWTGSEYGLVFTRNSRIYFTRISSAGAKIGGDIPVSDASGIALAPSLVWTGSEYAVTWQDARDGNDEIYFTRLDTVGSGMGGELRLTTDTAASLTPRLVDNGAGFGVAWTDDRDGNNEIYFALLDTAGSKLTVDLRITSDAAVSETPDLAWTGSEYGLAWRDRRDGNGEIYFALLTSAGVQVGSDTPVTVAAGNSALPRLQWNGDQYGVAWRDRRDGNNEIYFVHLDSVGVKLSSDLRVTNDAGESTAPSLVWRGSSFGITWTDDRDGNDEIYFTRVSCACGSDDDGDGFTDCDGDCDLADGTVYPGAPPVSCDGLNNDCNDPFWPSLTGTDDGDNDGDGLSFCEGDCLDANDQVYPGAPQICDGLNNDCDAPGWPSLAGTNDGDNDGDTLSACAGDCDDTSACTRPGAALLDSVSLCMRDCDLDDWGDATPPAGVIAGSDCDDTQDTVYPGALEICDGFNNDCLDPEWPSTATQEADNDGDGLAECAGDCDDTRSAVYPGAPQVCDGVNNDCLDPNWPSISNTDEADDDTDGYSECQGDCNDFVHAINPGETESCDGVDEDCDGLIDEDFDLDGDLVASCAGDCDNNNPAIYPGAPQICDGLNNDCNHPNWPSLTGTDEVEDWDGDGYTGCQDDCDVLDPSTNPGGTEICDNRDNDCDGVIDDVPGCNHACDLAAVALPERDLVDMRHPGASGYTRLIAHDDGFAIAWVESRLNESLGEVYFARLDAQGGKIGGDIRISAPDVDPDLGSLVWTGSEFGVAWADYRNTTPAGGVRDIYFARLDASGQRIGDEIRLTSQPADVSNPRLVWSGTEYGLVWIDRQGADHPTFQRLGATGLPAGPQVKLSGNPPLYTFFLNITWTGTHYAVVWVTWDGGDTDLSLGLIDAQGIIARELPIVENIGSTLVPEIHWTGSELGVFWFGSQQGIARQLYFARFDGFGERLSADMALTQEPFDFDWYSAVWTGAEYGIGITGSLEGSSSGYFLRIDPQGSSLGNGDLLAGIYGGTVASSPISVAWNGQLYGATWYQPLKHDPVIGYYFPNKFTRILCGCADVDGDGDGALACNDCDDGDPDTYFGAPQACDGINNDCFSPSWPALAGTNEADDDADGYAECAGDCDDAHASVYPGAPDICNGFNDDCNDPDWPSLENSAENSSCVIDILIGPEAQFVWDSPTAYDAWNVYRGDLAVLKSIPPWDPYANAWTQVPGSNTLAARSCGLTVTELDDTPPLQPGEVAFYFTTGMTGIVESGLGQWHLESWTDGQRTNLNPCP